MKAEFVWSTLGRVALHAAKAYSLVNAKWRAALPERRLLGDWQTAQFAPGTVWCHAASVGEVIGLAPLLNELKAEAPLLLTTTSVTGKNEAIKRELADNVLLLPFDHPTLVEKALATVNPRLLVVSETELWPNLLFSAQRQGVRCLLVNGRISDYSFPNYQRFRSLIQPALSVFENVLVQTPADRERFVALGAEPSTVDVVGSTKYDTADALASEEELSSFAAQLGIDRDKPCFVAGSVRELEDKTVVEAYLQAKMQHPELQLLIAPRHPERFDEASNLLSSMGLNHWRRSAGEAPGAQEVVLLDTLGELRMAYGLGTVSFVGGSLVNIGGHNPLEPAAYGQAVLLGPHTSTVRDAVAALKDVGGAFEVRDTASLTECLLHLLEDANACASAGAAARAVSEANLGATSRTLSYLALGEARSKAAPLG